MRVVHGKFKSMTGVMLVSEKAPYPEAGLYETETFPGIAAGNGFWVGIIWFFDESFWP